MRRLVRYGKQNKILSSFKPNLLIHRKDFQLGIEQIRSRFNIVAKKGNYAPLKELLFNKNFDKKVSKLIHALKIKEAWRDFIYRYIVSNQVEWKFDPDTAIIEEGLPTKDSQTESEFYIKSPELLSDKNLIATKKLILKFQDSKARKQKLWGKFERDSTIYEMKQQNKEISEIWRTIKDKYKEDLDYGNIKQIASTYVKKLKSYF